MSWLIAVAALFFFFFQAEDGIRDYKVTGVQTCALPISAGTPRRADDPRLRTSRHAHGLQDLPDHAVRVHVLGLRLEGERSEERRVGKECRSRWSPYH